MEYRRVEGREGGREGEGGGGRKGKNTSSAR